MKWSYFANVVRLQLGLDSLPTIFLYPLLVPVLKGTRNIDMNVTLLENFHRLQCILTHTKSKYKLLLMDGNLIENLTRKKFWNFCLGLGWNTILFWLLELYSGLKWFQFTDWYIIMERNLIHNPNYALHFFSWLKLVCYNIHREWRMLTYCLATF